MASPLVVLDSACLAFGHHALLEGVNFQLDPGERVGLIGRNGSGKSSLLGVIAGTIKLDDGKVWTGPSLRRGFVAQEPLFDLQLTVFEQVAQSLGDLCRLVLDYHEVSRLLGNATENIELLLSRLQDLQTELEHQNGWTLNSRIDAVLGRLTLPADTPISELSGGQKKRVALAQALVADPELLILDEPTNHLDVATIEWLEELLKKFSGSVLFVTHDRRFLDNVATRIVELDRGAVSSFPGNYSIYEHRKSELLSAETVQREKFDKFLAQEELWIRKGIEARRTRNEGRVRRLEQLRRERASRRERIGRVAFNIDQGQLSGKLVAELEHVTKSFANTIIVDDFSGTVLRGDKVGLIGPNGIGKTTFLKLVLGELAPDSGRVRLGTKLSVAYFDQFRSQLDDNATVADTIVQGSQFVEINGERKHVISYLGDFLFPTERARARVSALSGGERNRLLLARLFTQPANVLVLDEPTNDLDIETLELLESLLQEYSGTLFIVSHDRAFLDNIVTQVIVFEGNGNLVEYAGAYQDWREQRSFIPLKPKKGEVTNIPPAKTRSERPVKLSFNETRELESIPNLIHALEQEQQHITTALTNADLYRENPEKIKNLRAEFASNEKRLAEKFARWEELEAKKVLAETKLTQKDQ